MNLFQRHMQRRVIRHRHRKARAPRKRRLRRILALIVSHYPWRGITWRAVRSLRKRKNAKKKANSQKKRRGHGSVATTSSADNCNPYNDEEIVSDDESIVVLNSDSMHQQKSVQNLKCSSRIEAKVDPLLIFGNEVIDYVVPKDLPKADMSSSGVSVLSVHASKLSWTSEDVVQIENMGLLEGFLPSGQVEIGDQDAMLLDPNSGQFNESLTVSIFEGGENPQYVSCSRDLHFTLSEEIKALIAKDLNMGDGSESQVFTMQLALFDPSVLREIASSLENAYTGTGSLIESKELLGSGENVALEVITANEIKQVGCNSKIKNIDLLVGLDMSYFCQPIEPEILQIANSDAKLRCEEQENCEDANLEWEQQDDFEDAKDSDEDASVISDIDPTFGLESGVSFSESESQQSTSSILSDKLESEAFIVSCGSLDEIVCDTMRASDCNPSSIEMAKTVGYFMINDESEEEDLMWPFGESALDYKTGNDNNTWDSIFTPPEIKSPLPFHEDHKESYSWLDFEEKSSQSQVNACNAKMKEIMQERTSELPAVKQDELIHDFEVIDLPVDLKIDQNVSAAEDSLEKHETSDLMGLENVLGSNNNLTSSLTDLVLENIIDATPKSPEPEACPSKREAAKCQKMSCPWKKCNAKRTTQNIKMKKSGKANTESDAKCSPSDGKIVSVKRSCSLCILMMADQLKTPEYEKQFRSFAKFGDRRKSGVVITKKNNDLWLRQSGIVDEDFTSADGLECFTMIAKKKLVLTLHEYFYYIVKVAKKKKVKPSDIVEMLSKCGPPKNLSLMKIPSDPQAFTETMKRNKKKYLIDGLNVNLRQVASSMDQNLDFSASTISVLKASNDIISRSYSYLQ